MRLGTALAAAALASTAVLGSTGLADAQEVANDPGPSAECAQDVENTAVAPGLTGTGVPDVLNSGDGTAPNCDQGGPPALDLL